MQRWLHCCPLPGSQGYALPLAETPRRSRCLMLW
uniref:Uncharacterized protein n=1 Tax=Rhizophora mucronata TaxID=61149 RepID=A0A2P2PXI0_RHIMU